MPGFFLLVGARSKTFIIQGDLWENGKRRTIRVKVGQVGKIATREARAKAKVLLGSISDGVDPRPKPQEPVSPSRLLKRSLRLRNQGGRRDFLRPDAAHF